MTTYTITLHRKFLNKKITKVKGHYFAQDVPKNILIVIRENEERIFINTNNYSLIEFSDGLYKSILEKAREESNNAVKAEHLK